MGISEKKMQIVIDNYFKQECDINTSIRGAFEKGFRIGVKKGQSAQPEPHWIPCEEEMPKEKEAGVLQKIGIQNKSDNVFVTIDTEKGKMVGIACTWDGMWKWDGIFAFPKWKVIAWMPFPAPYQEGEIE